MLKDKSVLQKNVAQILIAIDKSYSSKDDKDEQYQSRIRDSLMSITQYAIQTFKKIIEKQGDRGQEEVKGGVVGKKRSY